jgi:MFS family permease
MHGQEHRIPARHIDNGRVKDWAFAVRALRSRNYSLFFGGQSISLVGTWMTRIAASWLVYRLTGSATLLGVVGFAGQIAGFVLAPLAGVWVDRWDRHKTLVWTQVLSMLQSLALAGLALAGIINIQEIIWLAFAQGIINAFDMPVRQAFVVQMVERREDLGNAIALNSSMVNAARLIGPAIAGVLISGVGEGYCFLIDGISYVAVILSLLLMRIPKAPARAVSRRVWEELREGWDYVSRSVSMRSILLLLALISLVGVPYSVLMPIFASQILHGGPHTLGFLMAATGIGALAGALSLAMRATVLGLGRRIVEMSALFGASMIGFALSGNLWVSIAILPVTGFAMMQTMAASNTILQTIADDQKRGRVMAFYSTAFLGMAPFGSLLAGIVAARIGAPETLVVGGVACMAGSLWFRRELPSIRREVRPKYVELGIIPEIAAGVQTASVLQTPPEN